MLEVGTGSGYQAAVLATLGADVYTIEIVPALARERTDYAGATRIRPASGPVSATAIAAGPKWRPSPRSSSPRRRPKSPPALLAQLAPGGRLVIPVGTAEQELQVHERTADGVRVRSVIPVRFVPMTGGCVVATIRNERFGLLACVLATR